MRVLYSFPHTLGKPGIGTTAYEQVKGLIGHGVDVSVYCTSLARDPGRAREVVETMAVAGHRLPHRAIGVERAYRHHDRCVARALRRRSDDFDIVHCWPAGCLRTLDAARSLAIPSIRTAPNPHTATVYADSDVAAASAKVALPPGHSHRFDAGRLERELAEFELADLLLVPSDSAERSFLDRGVPAERLARNRYGFDPDRFWPLASKAAGERPLTVTFAGRGDPTKGLHLALRAWIDSGAAERGRFVVCGAILPEYRRRISPLLDHPGVEELGFVGDLGAVLRRSDVLVLPSFTEGSALVTYEAQACGCVLVISDATGAVCRHLESGLVHPAGDLAALTAHLRLLDRDRDLLAQLRRSTIDHSRDLTWERAAFELAGVYRAALEPARRAQRRTLAPAIPEPGG